MRIVIQVIAAGLVAQAGWAAAPASETQSVGSERRGFAQAGTADEVVQNYLTAEPVHGVMDAPEPYYDQVVALGAEAVPSLLDALGRDDLADRRTGIIWALGQIGDPRAFDPLWTLFTNATGAGERMRIGYSLGSSLDRDNAEQLLQNVEALSDPRGIDLLKQITQQDFGADLSAWRAWLQEPGRVDEVVAYCRKRSVPQLG